MRRLHDVVETFPLVHAQTSDSSVASWQSESSVSFHRPVRFVDVTGSVYGLTSILWHLGESVKKETIAKITELKEGGHQTKEISELMEVAHLIVRKRSAHCRQDKTGETPSQKPRSAHPRKTSARSCNMLKHTMEANPHVKSLTRPCRGLSTTARTLVFVMVSRQSCPD